MPTLPYLELIAALTRAHDRAQDEGRTLYVMQTFGGEWIAHPARPDAEPYLQIDQAGELTICCATCGSPKSDAPAPVVGTTGTVFTDALPESRDVTT